MAAATFILNGHPCYNIRQLRIEAKRQRREQIKVDFNVSEWIGKANSFCHRRGADPSFGYLIGSLASVNGSGGLTIQLINAAGERVYKTFTVQVEWARKITPAATEDRGLYLVRVVDSRYAMADSLVGKRFNLVTGFTPPSSGQQYGSFDYHSDTVKLIPSGGGGEPSKVPYSWTDLFDEVWKTSDNSNLQTSGVTFPEYIPQDLDWRYRTRRDALQMLLQWTQTSIILNDSNQWQLISVEDQSNQSRDEALNQLKPYRIKDRQAKLKEAGAETPDKLLLHFRKLNGDGETSEYEKLERTPAGFTASKQLLSLRLPAYYVGGEVNPVQQVGNIADAFLSKVTKHLAAFPSQERVFSSFRVIYPSAFIEEVTWFNLGDSPRTRVVSIHKRDWLIRPTALTSPGEDKTRIAVGKVIGEVTEATPSFLVGQLRAVVGEAPETGSAVLTTNTHFQSYHDGQSIMIFSEKGRSVWDTDASGGDNSLIRFELAEDKHTEDFARLAFVLDNDGNRTQTPDPENPLSTINLTVYVGDAWNKFHGFMAYEDAVYGEQRGYRGFAKLKLTNYLASKPLYEIIEMEQQARFVETTLWGAPGGVDEAEIPDEQYDFPGGTETGYAKPSDNYWNGRPPKTQKHTFGESTGSQEKDVIPFVDRHQLFGRVTSTTPIKLIWDEQQEQYTLWIVKPAQAIVATIEFVVSESFLGATIEQGNKLRPTTFLVRRWLPEKIDGTYTGLFIREEEQLRAISFLTADVIIASGRHRIAVGIEGVDKVYTEYPWSEMDPPPTVKIYNLDCSDIDLTGV